MGIICGIYKIVSPTNKIYIGQSTNILVRKRVYSELKCSRQPKIFNSIKKHGWRNHIFEIIHLCDKQQLNQLEKYYVDLFKTFNSKYGLNLKDGGGNEASMCDETKRKIGIANKNKPSHNKGKPMSIEQRIKISNSLKGHKHSPETKRKIGLIHKGRRHSDEAKRKISLATKGRVFSKETKTRMSEATKGKRKSFSTRQNMRKAKTGIKLSEEHKKNIGKSRIGKTINSKTKPHIEYIKNNLKHKTQQQLANELHVHQSTISKLIKKW